MEVIFLHTADSAISKLLPFLFTDGSVGAVQREGPACPTNPHFCWNSPTCLWSGQSASCCLVTQKCFQYLEPAAPPSGQLVWVGPNCLESPTNVPPSPPWLSSTAEPNSKMGQEPNSQTMQTEAPGWFYLAGSGLLSLILF